MAYKRATTDGLVPRDARPSIDGIVLAAGRSSRIGRSKPLLRVHGGGETFLERAVRRLTDAGCRSVTTVVAASDEPVHRLARALDARVIENAEPESQPIDSVRLAVTSLPEGSDAAIVLPVDVPLVNAETVAAVVNAFAARRTPIVAPSYRGELGHPVLISRPLFRAVMTGPLEEGLRSLLDRRRHEIEAVHVDDPGTLIDIDTIGDYDRFIARAD